jgi:hypothetical protein
MTIHSSLPVAGYVEKLGRFGVDADPSEVAYVTEAVPAPAERVTVIWTTCSASEAL